MKHKSAKVLKATILHIIVAFLLAVVFFLVIKMITGQKIEEIFTMVNYLAVDTEKKQTSQMIVTPEEGIKEYPEYGTQYARIKIDKIDVDLPVYFGDTLEILKNGVGHSGGSYFPGEGGTVIYMGHNSKQVFRRFSELQKEDRIAVITDYGEFNYVIEKMELIEETQTDKLPIQKEEEILILYTCYPFNNIGYTKQRYVVYAKLV